MVLQSKRIGRFFMIGVYDYTVIATYLSLLLGLGGLYSAAQNEPLDAMLCLMLAGLLGVLYITPIRVKKPQLRGVALLSIFGLGEFAVLLRVLTR